MTFWKMYGLTWLLIHVQRTDRVTFCDIIKRNVKRFLRKCEELIRLTVGQVVFSPKSGGVMCPVELQNLKREISTRACLDRI